MIGGLIPLSLVVVMRSHLNQPGKLIEKFLQIHLMGIYEPACNLAVLTKSRRKVVIDGLSQLGEHDRALRTLFFPEQCCVTCGPKHAVAITLHPSAFQDPMIHWDASLIRSTLQEISPSLIIIAVSYSSSDDGLHHNDVLDEVECHCHVTGVPYLQVDVADTTRWQQQAISVYPIVGIGDISFISNDENLAESFDWRLLRRLDVLNAMAVCSTAWQA